MPVELTRPEIVWGVLVVVGAFGMVLHKLGLVEIRLKRPGNGAAKCPDPACHRTVEEIGSDVQELVETIKVDIFPKVNRTAEAVARIEGWIEGKQH